MCAHAFAAVYIIAFPHVVIAAMCFSVFVASQAQAMAFIAESVISGRLAGIARRAGVTTHIHAQ
jgi:hypothetical protein